MADFLVIQIDETQSSSEASFNDEERPIKCGKCSNLLGQTHSMSDGYKLFKYNLALSFQPGQPPITYSPELWLTCFLLSAITTQGVRRFTVTPAHDNSPAAPIGLDLWIFTPDLTISTETRAPFRVAKILWRASEPATLAGLAHGRLDRASLAQGSLTLPSGAFRLLGDYLARSAEILPSTARTFQGWQVGILRRFDAGDAQG